MILQELCALYDRLQADDSVPESAMPPLCFTSENVGMVLEIDEAGFLCYVSVFQDGAKKTTRQLAVPEHTGRTSGVKPFFLCDTAEYLAGYVDTEGLDAEQSRQKLAKATKKRHASAELHHCVMDDIDDMEAQAVLCFFDDPRPLDALSGDLLSALKEAKGFAVLRVKGHQAFVHENPVIREAWKRYCNSRNDNGVATGQCSVTGREDVPIARLFPMVSGFYGAQSAGASLVSFNCDAFESYGKKQALNASISQSSADAAGAALKYLCKDQQHRVRFGNLTVLFWSDRPAPRENDLVFAMLNGSAVRAEDELQTARIAQLFADMRAGRRLAALNLSTRFYILGLSPNAARLSVRFFYADTLDQLTEHFGEYLRDMAIDGCTTTSIFRLMRQTALLDDQENVPQTVIHDCARAMLQGAPFPRMLYTAVLGRMRADHGCSKPWDRGERASLMKAYLVRRRRLLGSIDDESELSMSLSENNSDSAYVLGRLFALIENVQGGAQGSVGATITDRYIGAASTTPARCFPSLFRNLQNNMSKLRKTKPGIAVVREKQLEGVIGLLDGSKPLPASLDEEAQGRFFIGYYQQREKLYEKKPTESGSNADGNEQQVELEA